MECLWRGFGEYIDESMKQFPSNSPSLEHIKKGVWLYFLLLIFEGGIRKWILPGLATPLLVVRDPIAIWLIFQALKHNIIKTNWYISSMLIIGMLGVFTAVLFGHGNLYVAIYGARILIYHFPLIFIIGRIFTYEDVLKMGRATLIIAIPMALLTAAQFYSPQSAFVNRGIGGDEAGGGFTGALGFFRPPGTFSFTNGNSLFFSFVAPWILFFWFAPGMINKWILISATCGLIIAIPLSISRSLFFSVGVSVAFTLVAALRKPELLKGIFGGIIIMSFAIIILSQFSFFSTAVEAFTNRFDGANESEGGVHGVLVDRYLGGLVGAISNSSNQPFWGYGIGMGTKVGSMLLSGKTIFLISEEEWGRLVGEMGPLMGLSVIFIRIALSFKMAVSSFKALSLDNMLPWVLLSFGILSVPQAQWAQPTSLGFSILIGGLIIASFNKSIEARYNLQ
jgi:hypothetical protein